MSGEPATFAETREQAIAEVLAAFSDSDPTRALRHAVHAAFMRGAWAGRAAENAGEILDLAEADRAELMAQIEASRIAREGRS